MNFHYINKQSPLILASASPRRERLLAQTGLPFRPVASDVEEEGLSGEPEEVAQILAERKASQVALQARNSWILGADTMVVVDGEILGKPKHMEDAKRMLWRLNGREHRVITGFCVLNPLAAVAHKEAVTTLVKVKTLTGREIDAYVKTNEPFGKAGGYAIQGIGSFMVSHISGSYTNVVGLPICSMIEALLLLRALEGFPIPHKSHRTEEDASGL